jgi:carbon-monoxide dehydrogenase medium subunit/6-hydroxypseudooxynicotine dehydrogenase subunit alpha
MLNFRLAHPERLIDINRIGELAYVQRREGVLHIGALTRHAALERSKLVAENWPLLTEAMRWVAHPQIRNRGTVGGSVAHADPAAELPVAFAALDARFTARSVRGDRVIPWEEFFVTHLTTTLEPDELLAEIEVPKLPERTGHAFTEFARRHGDFGLGGAAVMLSMDASGACERASIALLAAAPTPLRASKAEDVLRGAMVDAESVAAAARAAVEDIEPTGDIHGSSEYRLHLIEALVRRGLLAAAADAEARNG